MIEIEFTSQLVKQVDCPALHSTQGDTVRSALETLFDQFPGLREQVLSSEGSVLPHLAIFVNGEMINSDSGLDAVLRDGSDVFVMQAVSGG